MVDVTIFLSATKIAAKNSSVCLLVSYLHFLFFSVFFFLFFITALHRSAPYRAGFAFVAPSCFSLIAFFFTLTDIVQKAQNNAGSRPVVVTPPHPQTLAHIR